MKPADHNEECRVRIVRHMTADDNLNQRVQTAQDRIVETTLPEARIGERDPVPEPARKKVRFAERAEDQTPKGTVATNSRTSCSSSSSYPVKPRLYHRCRLMKAIRTAQKRQKVTHVADMEVEGLNMDSERDRLQRHSDHDFLMQVKLSADVFFDRICPNDRRKRKIVKKELVQLGVHSSVHVAEVFSSRGTARFVHRFGVAP